MISTLPPAAGCFDIIELTGSRLRAAGWMLSPRAPIESLRAHWDGAPRAEARPAPRPDVLAAHPSIRQAAQAGFDFTFPVDNGGRGRVDVVGYVGSAAAARLGIRLFGAAEMGSVQPPAELTLRVSGAQGDVYRVRGLKCFTDLLDQAERHGPLAEDARVLDWGCGCGALSALFLRHLPRIRLAACDVDPRGIEWCRVNLAGAQFQVTGLQPPLPYADASFDLVIGSSVFTHLRPPEQRAWLAELRRILRPGGLLMASAMGRGMYASFINRPHRRWRLLRKLHFLLRGFDGFQLDRALYGVAPDHSYRDVYQTRAHVRREWSRFFEIVDHLDNGLGGAQDLVVMRR